MSAKAASRKMQSRIDKRLADAERAYQAGDLIAAEAAYRDVLKMQPLNIAALYALGVISQRTGDPRQAIERLDQAIAIESSAPAPYYVRGLAYLDVGCIDDAIDDFRQATALKPDYADAYNVWGVALKRQQRIDGAIEKFERAIACDPASAAAYTNLGNAFVARGDLSRALDAHRRATLLQPESIAALNSLGTTCIRLGMLDDARQSLEAALRLRPDYVEALNNLGVVFQKQGRLVEAHGCFSRALEIEPESAHAWVNRAAALNEENDFRRAIECCRRALEITPEFPEAYLNLGLAFKDIGMPLQALKYFEAAVRLRPDYGAAYNGIANACRDQGQYVLAEKFFREALRCDPADHEVHSNLLFIMSHHVLMPPAELLDAHREWAAIHCAPGRAQRYTHNREAAHDGRRLRIGYVSPDFRRHAVSFFLEPLIAAHDRSQFEIFCYAEIGHADDVTARFKSFADGWRDTMGMSDAQLAQIIHDDRIDILVDLAGHTAGNRLKAFAYKPAPVQATYLGYCATTGLEEIDYWITDDVIHPADTPELAVETIVRLPRCWVVYRPPVGAPDVQVPARDHVVFGCFNDRSKITEEAVAAWSRILQRVPESRLVLKARQYGDPDIRAELTGLFMRCGVEAARIEFRALSLPAEYMASYHDVDIALDPFPRHGGVTTADAVWMGVPVITLIGERFIERHAASLLTAIGASEWIADTVERYIDSAVALALDASGRRATRATQRQRVLASPLVDGHGLARAIEALYRAMWRRYRGDGAC